jgi:hypothetical protein
MRSDSAAGFFARESLTRGVAMMLTVAATLGLAATRADADQVVQPGVLEFENEQYLLTTPGDVADDLEKRLDEEGTGSREMIVAPLPSRDPVLGWTLAVPAVVFYRPPSSKPNDGTWISGVSVFYAENESWGAGAFHRMSVGDDRWRITSAVVYGDVNYDYFGIGEDADRSISLNQSISLIMAEALSQVYPDFFVGLRGSYMRSEVGLNIPPDALPPGLELPDLGVKFDLTTLSPRAVYDTRDTEFYPTKGTYLDGKIDIGRESLGSDRNYELYQLRVNGYRSISESTVLATRVAVEYVSGDAPFFRFPAFGSKGDLRGYQAGSYRDRFLFAAQAEFRYRFRPRIGAVMFAGLGTVAPGWAEWGKSLTSIGAGVRWVVAAENNVSLRIDVARGRDDTEFYIGFGEAF